MKLVSIAAITPNDLWAVGSYSIRGTDQTLVEHWDGSSWTLIPSPNVGSGSNFLAGVAAIATNDVWAVGGGSSGSLVEHWNGSTWSIVASPFAGWFNAIAAVTPSDIWAVGGAADEPLVVHWNGTAWTQVLGPGGGANFLSGVAVLSATDVWAVGWAHEDVHLATSDTLVAHWNGTAWTPVPSPNPRSALNTLRGIAAVTPNDVWAVGISAPEGALVEHWDGGAWSIVANPEADTINSTLFDLTASSATDMWAVGSAVQHWDGSAWHLDSSIRDGYLAGVVAGTPGDVWAVGSLNNTYPGGPALVERYRSAEFADVPPASPFFAFVHCLTCRNIIGGYSDDSFRPGNAVTRGQFAKFLSNAAAYTDTIPPTRQSFTDVPPEHPFWRYIERAAAHGVISGYSNGDGTFSFRPGANVTRGQAAKVVANAANFTDAIPATQQTFSDVPPANPFWLYIERVKVHVVISGYADGTFHPHNTVTRGQTAKFIANAFFPNCQIADRH
jgi:hypothetical protein